MRQEFGIIMATAEDDFRKWFVESLAPLRSNGDAGFVFAMVAFPLLERHLRNKSGCPEGKPLKEVFVHGHVDCGLSEGRCRPADHQRLPACNLQVAK
jgi:hypothetical protein